MLVLVQTPDGALVLVSADGDAEYFSKGFERYGTNATDDDYYLGLGRAAVASTNTDVLGQKLLAAGQY